MNKNEITVNGIPLIQLSEVSQKFFDRLVNLKKEIEELQTKTQQKEAAVKEISDMILEEINQIKTNSAQQSVPLLSPLSEEEKLNKDPNDQL